MGQQQGIASGIAQRVEAAVLPVLAQHGYDLVLLEFVAHGRVLRLYIDREAGVTLEDCTRVSRLVSDTMDAEGLSEGIDGRFTLEVSSPGLDRPLTRPRDFQRFVSRKVQLTTREPLDGRRRFAGELVDAGETGISLNVDGKTWSIGYSAIDRARLVPEF